MAGAAQGIPRAAVRGLASGVLFMAFFGTLWASIGVGGLQGWGTPWFLVVASLFAIALLGGGLLLWRGAGRLPDRDAGARGSDRREGLWFGVVFGLEGASIAVANLICNATGHSDRFFPIMALIVGIHFFPLAWLFHHRQHYLTGALLCLIGLVALLAVPMAATLGGREVMSRSLVVGFGCAVTLWGTGLGLGVQGGRMLRHARPA